jgi:hypothetical protein
VKSFSQIEVGLTFNAETEIPSSGILCWKHQDLGIH